MPEPFEPRDHDDLVEPLFAGLRGPARADLPAPSRQARPLAWWGAGVLGLGGLGLLVLWWI